MEKDTDMNFLGRNTRRDPKKIMGKDLENKEITRCDRVVRRMRDGYSNEPVGAKEPDRSTAETISTDNTTRKKK